MSDLNSVARPSRDMQAVRGLEEGLPRLDMKAALADARCRPQLYRLADEERERLLFLARYCPHAGIVAAARKDLALDDEARNAP
jgi:hypothetical protein